MGRWISERARQTPRRSAIEFDGRATTYAKLDARSTDLARALLHYGLNPGDRIATLTENRPEHVELLFACAKAGLIMAPLNWRLAAPELAAQLKIFTPALITSSNMHRARMEEAHSLAMSATPVIDLETLAQELGPASLVSALPAVDDDDGLLIIATSGTTGTPKGVVLTHANCFWTNLGFDLAAPMNGVEVVQGYGLTEASPNVLCLAPEDASTHLGSVGKPYTYVEVELHDDDTGAFVEGAGRGEIYVRGPNVFPGYWNNPAATAAAFDDGWLRTGDVAERDEAGYYRICGRAKEMFVSGGENVYPAEVEQVLAAYAGVADAAVIAIAHPRWGETGVAFVVAKRGTTLDTNALTLHCRANLAAYKVPSQFRVVDELPRSTVGKVDRVRLTTMANEH